MRRALRFVLAALAFASTSTRGHLAWADGAFPDAFGPLLPRTRPHEIVLATNFGLVSSQDDGATWAYACELPASAMGRLYNLGAPPDERIYAVATGLIATADGGCHWTVGGGALAGAVALDDFPDPGDAAHVVGIAAAAGARDAAVYESHDFGVTFAGPLFAAPAGAVVTGVEIAAADPATLYVSFYETAGVHPRLARSSDAGARWRTIDLEPGLGSSVPFLAAVDPVDPGTVYLRLSGRNGNMDLSNPIWSVMLPLPPIPPSLRRA